MQLAARHEARVGTHLSIAWSLPPAVAAAIRALEQSAGRRNCRAWKSWKSRSRGRSPTSCARPASAAELPDSMLGPVSKWMDELSIYPDELFTIMAQRAAIYATAESYA
jgi:hypothetical protein